MTCRKMQSRYRPLSCGYSICLVSLKLFERSTHPSSPACFAPSRVTQPCNRSGNASLIACTNAWSMTLTNSSAPSDSTQPKRKTGNANKIPVTLPIRSNQ